MACVLLWIENLAVSLLLIATIFALVGRFRWRWLGFIVGLVIWVPLVIFIFIWYLGITLFTLFVRLKVACDSVLFYYAFALTIGYLVGLICLCIAGVKRKKNDPVMPAAKWPLRKMSLAFVIVLGLHLTTIWFFDFQARRKLASLGAEANALALSIAPPRAPDDDNAALLYSLASAVFNRALDRMPKLPEGTENAGHKPWDIWWDSMDQPDFNFSDPELVRFLQSQTGTIALMLDAVNKPCCYVENNYNRPDPDMESTEMYSYRDLAILLVLHARCKAAAGDVREAIKDINALFALGKHAANEALQTSTLLACFIDRIAVENLQAILAAREPQPGDLEQVKLDGELSYQKLMRHAIRFEEVKQLNVFPEIGSTYGYPIPDKEARHKDISPLTYHLFFMDDEIKDMKRYSTRINELTSRPYFQFKDDFRKLLDNIKNKPQSATVRWFSGGMDYYFQAMGRGDAQALVGRTCPGNVPLSGGEWKISGTIR